MQFIGIIYVVACVPFNSVDVTKNWGEDEHPPCACLCLLSVLLDKGLTLILTSPFCIKLNLM